MPWVEIPERRGAKARHERDTDTGQLRALITAHDQHYLEHYLDGTAAWQPVDESFRDDTELGFQQRADKLRHIIRVADDGSRRWYPRRDHPDEYVEVGIPQMAAGTAGPYANIPIVSKPARAGRALTWDQPQFTLNIEAVACGFRVQIVLKAPGVAQRFRWPFSLTGLTRRGDLLIGQDGTTVGLFGQPTAYDANDATVPMSLAYSGGFAVYSIDPAAIGAARFPVTVDPDFAIDAADGYVNGQSTTYATARSTASGSDVIGTSFRAGQTNNGTSAFIYRAALKFDTSTIGAGSMVTQVNLSMALTSAGDKSTAVDFDVEIRKFDWSASDPIVAATREAFYDGALTAVLDQIWRNTLGIAQSTMYASPNLDVTWVNKAGPTYYALTSSRDTAGTGTAPATTTDEYVSISAAEATTTTVRPVLTVLYSTAINVSVGFIASAEAVYTPTVSVAAAPGAAQTISLGFIPSAAVAKDPTVSTVATVSEVTVNSMAVDGYIRGDNAVYATAQVDATYNNAAQTSMQVGQYFDTQYHVSRGLLKFDTSIIGAGAVINSAVLGLVAVSDLSTAADFDIEICKVDWSTQDPIASTNRDAVMVAINNAVADKVWRNTLGIAVSTQYTSPALDPTWINPTGPTYYALRSSRDAADIAPTGNEYLTIATSENTGAGFAPVLTVNYTAGNAPAQTVTVTFIASAGAVYAPTVFNATSILQPTFIPSAEAVYAPTVIVGAIPVSVGFIPSAGAVYAPRIVLPATIVSPTFIPSREAVYAPTVAAAVLVSVGFIPSQERVFEPSVSPIGIFPDFIDSEEDVWAPTVNVRPPVISGVSVLDTSANGAAIGWTTDIPATSEVEYGTTPAFGASSGINTAPTTQHSVNISGLQLSTLYYFRVRSVAGVETVSDVSTFMTTGPAPVISNIAVAATYDSATVAWSTDVPSDSEVQYGLTAAYGSTSGVFAEQVRRHEVLLTNLRSGTLYHYRVLSQPPGGDTAVAGDFTFTTSTPPLPTLQVFSSPAPLPGWARRGDT